MALKRNETYPGRFSNPTSDHPQGAFKNRSAPGAQDGSFCEQRWANDWDGFFGRLLTLAEVTPNGNVDTASSSQYYDALKSLFLQRTNPFADIKADDTVKTALENLQLRESFSGVVGQSRNARMSVATASATATFSADELIVEDSAGRQYRLGAFSKTINLATTGAGGMDTGTVPTTGFVALYAIYNPTTATSALLTVDATGTTAPEIYGGANMPSGFTASALVSIWRIVSSQLVIGYQDGRRVFTQLNSVATFASPPTSPTSLSISTYVPRNAKYATLATRVTSNTGTGPIGTVLLSDATTLGRVANTTHVSYIGVSFDSAAADIQMLTMQTVYYYTSVGGSVSSYSLIIYNTGYGF